MIWVYSISQIILLGILYFLVFFFQAEDGIRDRNVTGVQTCALPIFGLGLALPFLVIAFVPILRNKLPKPGRWMQRLQRFLAIPMAASAAAALWLLQRQAGEPAFLFGLFAVAALVLCLYFAGRIQHAGRPQARFAMILALV